MSNISLEKIYKYQINGLVRVTKLCSYKYKKKKNYFVKHILSKKLRYIQLKDCHCAFISKRILSGINFKKIR